MNPMNDQRFFDLAMKTLAGQSSEAERAELEALAARQPALKAEWDRLQADARLAKDILPLTEASESATGEFPSYARERLQTKVRQALGRPSGAEKRAGWNWQWLLVLAPATAVVVLLFVLLGKPAEPVIQVAMLDLAGTVRGAETNEISVLKQQWKEAAIQNFEKPTDLETWATTWPQGRKPAFKVIYDRTSGEVRVLGRKDGRSFDKTFPVERDLPSAVAKAGAFIREQTKH